MALARRYPITIKGETALFGWRNGRVWCENYDLENEKIALILAGEYGEGMGVFLVALDEMCKKERDLPKLLENFNERMHIYEELIDHEPEEFFAGAPMVYPYFSYSPEMNWRIWAAERGALSDAMWVRLLKEQNPYIVLAMLERAYCAPYTCAPYFTENTQIELARHPNVDVRVELCKFVWAEDAKIILAKDTKQEVTDTLCEKYASPLGLSEDVMRAMARGSKAGKISIAKYCSQGKKDYPDDKDLYNRIIQIAKGSEPEFAGVPSI